MPTGVEALVVEDLAKRQAVGIRKYNITVQDSPAELLAWMQHMYEELLDASVYLKKAMILLKEKTNDQEENSTKS